MSSNFAHRTIAPVAVGPIELLLELVPSRSIINTASIPITPSSGIWSKRGAGVLACPASHDIDA